MQSGKGMLTKQALQFIIVLVMVLVLPNPTVFAQDNKVEADKEQAEGSTLEPTMQPKYSQLSPHWFNFLWYSGGGLQVGDVALKATGEGDEKVRKYTADINGATSEHMAHFLFYPAKKRRFLLGFGLGVGDGVGRLLALDDESEFLDHKHFDFDYVVLPLIVGYRVFFGARQEISLNMSVDIAPYGQYFQIEGSKEEIELDGTSFTLHLGAHYRFSNGFLFGGEWRFRYYDAKSDEAKIVGHPVEMKTNGGLGTIGVLLGFEPI